MINGTTETTLEVEQVNGRVHNLVVPAGEDVYEAALEFADKIFRGNFYAESWTFRQGINYEKISSYEELQEKIKFRKTLKELAKKEESV